MPPSCEPRIKETWSPSLPSGGGGGISRAALPNSDRPRLTKPNQTSSILSGLSRFFSLKTRCIVISVLGLMLSVTVIFQMGKALHYVQKPILERETPRTSSDVILLIVSFMIVGGCCYLFLVVGVVANISCLISFLFVIPGQRAAKAYPGAASRRLLGKPPQ